MESVLSSGLRTSRGRGSKPNGISDRGHRGHSKNKTWVNDSGSRSGTNTPADHLGVHAERWERGGHGGGKGRRGRTPRIGSRSPRPDTVPLPVHGAPLEHDRDEGMTTDVDELQGEDEDIEEPVLETAEERERFYQELVKAREVERKKAIAEGKMDDPLVPKRLDEAITMVGTCTDMCPRFERYRRERENNLFEWEIIPGTRRVDHKRAVKMYERAAGDKTLPSDLRPPPVLKRTLDYLFHELLPRAGFSPTFNFIRDRSRSVRNDFTMQHETGALAMECHERCARFHILALHFERNTTGFSIALEEQQLMNTLQSLKEFYEDQRERYESPNELEMRIYHRLIHIRDQRERHDDIPEWILNDPVFLLTTRFRQRVQARSSPITKTSALVVDEESMQIFAELASVLRERGNKVMVYLVACILERLFGTDTIDDIEGIRDGLEIPDIIDGLMEHHEGTEVDAEENADAVIEEVDAELGQQEPTTSIIKPSATEWLSNNFGSTPADVFGRASSTSSSAFGASYSVFGAPAPAAPSTSGSQPAPPFIPAPSSVSAFSGLVTKSNAFGSQTFGSSGSAFGNSSGSVFGTSSTTNAFGAQFPVFGAPASAPTPTPVPAPAPAPVLTTDNALPAPSTNMPPLTFGTSTFGSNQTIGQAFLQKAEPAASASLFGGTGASDGLPSQSPFSPLGTKATTPFFGTPSLNPTAPPFTPKKFPDTPLESSEPSTLAADNETSKVTIALSSEAPAPQAVPSRSSSRPSLTPLNTTPPAIAFGTSSKMPFGGPQQVKQQPTLVFPKPQQTTAMDFGKSLVSGESSPSLKEPPPLNKVQPISLPPTPTATQFQSPAKQPIKSLFGFPSLQSVTTEPEILSPLTLTGPSLSAKPSVSTPLARRPSVSTPLARRPSVAESPTPARSTAPKDLGPASPTTNGRPRATSKGKERAVDVVGLEEKAVFFTWKSLAVRESFRSWSKRTQERVEWKAACRRSDAYRERVQHERLSKSVSANGKKRRDVSGPVIETPSRRMRRRISSHYEPPRTDEALAQRLKENHEQNERRWAPGTFLESIRARISSAAGLYPFDYRIWVSMNPDNDGTAIWVERKFDVPASGQWANERIFSIPLLPGDNQSNSPGFIVFECTPLGGIKDDLEIKFRVLEDCSRLRDIIEALPEDRHFIPSLLFIVWGEDDKANVPEELLQSTKKFVDAGTLQGYSVFSLSSTSTDLDSKFSQTLQTMTSDVAGALVSILSWEDLTKLMTSPFKEFASDWASRCSADGEIDWHLLNEVLKSLVNLVNDMANHLETRLNAESPSNPLPTWDVTDLSSSDDAYDSAFAWLQKAELQPFGAGCATDLTSYRILGAAFPVQTFVEYLHGLAAQQIEATLDLDKTVKYPVPKSDLQFMKDDMAKSVTKYAEKLRRTFAFYVRPKRRALDVMESSPTPSAKRLKTSTSSISNSEDAVHLVEGAVTNGRPTPSPSASPTVTATTIPDSPPKIVTVAMLRALSKNILRSPRKGR
ncbi:hypothetical protein EVG20_g2429 [Dentipellis fragilis]|uniref:SAC3/GANP/THP3 conserved domain-containing protein n=1 Tax=Dentipellis fragilis TaxID=205917 RepID=A0A4Y9ZB42_9AGAM|nr:hypothetical protein EVG20_g2429 [Dentipellis fragilis]